MNLRQCIFYDSKCYKESTKINGKPTGIVVHSTGANNNTLKRYVQPSKSDPNYAKIKSDLGNNLYNNHWNKSGLIKCVHAFIGLTAKGEIATYQTLPFDKCCWGVGSGAKGSYNYNPQARIQFEICEDNLKSESYFNAIYKEATEFCAYLCKTYGFGVGKISSHREAYKQGYGSNHGDIDHWLKIYGKTMNDFRADVQAILTPPKPQPKPTPPKTLKIGSSVKIIKNSKGYASGNALLSKTKFTSDKVFKVSDIRDGLKHPVLLSYNGSYIAWVDKSSIIL